jgi:molybdopterin converting factor small subunit
MRIKIRLLGVFSGAIKEKETNLIVPIGSTIGTIIQQLIKDDESLRSAIWDSQVNSPSPNALIMLDGVEINNLEGTETAIIPDQEIIILPVVHGG